MSTHLPTSLRLRKTLDDERLCGFTLIADGVEAGFIHVRRRVSHGFGVPPEAASHIGYRIELEHRRKGYATWMLAAALKEAAAMGLDSVVVCADEENAASSRVIERNGGTLTGIIRCADSGRIYRYEINLNTSEGTAATPEMSGHDGGGDFHTNSRNTL